MIRRPPRSTLSSSSAASDVYKRQSLPTRRVESGTKQRQVRCRAPVRLWLLLSGSDATTSPPHHIRVRTAPPDRPDELAARQGIYALFGMDVLVDRWSGRINRDHRGTCPAQARHEWPHP